MGGRAGARRRPDDHWDVFRGELERRGHDLDLLEQPGLLTRCDAEEILAALKDGELPSAAVSRKSSEPSIARQFPDRTVRAFGEMVDLLHQRGEETAAIALENLWNGLLENRRFALLCAYELDVFDLDAQTSSLPEIVRVHSHQRPVADPARLAAAVDAALSEVAGPDAAARVYLRVAENVPRTELPRAQAVLMWLSDHEPATARRVLQEARSRYAAGARRASTR